MPRNGTGTYTLPQTPFIPGTTISSSAVNSNFSDIAAALTASLPRDGQAGMIGQFKLPDGASNSPSMTFTNELGMGFSRSGPGVLSVDIGGVSIGTFTALGWTGAISSGVVPAGLTMVCPMSSIPAGWLVCDGSLISRTTYAKLFTALGATWSNGDGVTTFGIPDYRGRTIFGIDPGTGRLTSTYFGANPATFTYGGTQSHAMTSGEIASHFHSVSNPLYDPTHSHSYSAENQSVYRYQDASFPQGYIPASWTTGAASTGVRVQSSNGLDTTNSTGSATPFSEIPPAATSYWVIYTGL